jgi:hypothetical protein
MADLVTIAQSDSTNDGSGASTIMEPPQVDNAVNDAILIKVTQSLNNSTQVSNINVTTPTGYTLLVDLRDVEVRSWLYYKQSTGSETIPTVTSDTSARWTCTTAIVTDVDWANGGVTQQVSNTGGGDQQSLDLTTDSSGTASAIVCFYSIERRVSQGFRYPQTRPETVYSGTVTTGSSEGIDNAAGAGFDFIADRNTVWEGPFWEANSGGDSLSINVEVLVQGNIVPLQSATYVKQSAPANAFQTTMNWCREIVASGKDLDGNTLNTWTFDASTANTGNNRVTVTGHGMDESTVVYLSSNGNTPPTGLADDTFYYVEPRSADEIRFRSVNEDTDNVDDYYANGTSKATTASLSGVGSGTITLTEARMINAGQAVLDVFRPNSGSSDNVGTYSGNYIGDAGYNQNFVGTSQRFDSVFDATDETITFELQVNGNNRLNRVVMTLIDEDGDWINFKLYQKPVSPNSTGQLTYQFQVDQASVKALKYQEVGTFDHTRIRYLVIAGRGNNLSTNRFSAINSASSVVNLGGAFTVVGGLNTTLTQLVDLATTYTTSITKPSDLQVVSTVPLAIGNGSSDVSFVDSEKSIAFPPLADGVSTFQNYLDSLGVSINATANSTVKLQNSQIGASVPYTFDVIAASGATIDLTGNSYVFGTTALDADATYNRQLFVGGEGVTDNGAEIRNSTFIVNSQLGADKGIVELDSSTDIESSAFELASGTTTGHGIEIIATGSYTFNALTFSNFGVDGSSTAAIYNNSGGAVNIVINGGNNPTLRNGVGATTTLSLPLRNVSVTGLTAGSTLRVYNTTTSAQVVNQVVAGTSYTATYAEGVGYSVGDVLELRAAKIDKLEFTASVIATSAGWSALISQDPNPTYAAHGKDGSTVSGITWDSGNMQFDFNDADNQIDGADIGAWYYYFITTATGIAEAFGALSWPQVNKITNVTSKVAITFDNVKSAPLRINNCWIDRDDGASIIATGSNSIQIDPPAVFVQGLSDVALIKAKTDLLNFTGTDVKATLDSEAVVTDTASRDASKADLTPVTAELGNVDTSLQQRNVPMSDPVRNTNYGQSGF